MRSFAFFDKRDRYRLTNFIVVNLLTRLINNRAIFTKPFIITKNIFARGLGKQNYICVNCDRQFGENPKIHRGYSDEIKKICLKMYLNGMGFRGIERVTGVHHTTVINWVKQVGKLLPNADEPEVTVTETRKT